MISMRRGTILQMGYIHRGNICEANSSLSKWSRISFHSAQAPASKDVERILSILQVQFNVNRGPTLGWKAGRNAGAWQKFLLIMLFFCKTKYNVNAHTYSYTFTPMNTRTYILAYGHLRKTESMKLYVLRFTKSLCCRWKRHLPRKKCQTCWGLHSNGLEVPLPS
jgi:hypothetical protein